MTQAVTGLGHVKYGGVPHTQQSLMVVVVVEALVVLLKFEAAELPVCCLSCLIMSGPFMCVAAGGARTLSHLLVLLMKEGIKRIIETLILK